MKKRSNFIVFIAFLLVAVSLFSACEGNIPSENIITEEEEKPADENENNDGYLHIVSEGRSYFNIVYSERANRDTIELANELANAIFRKTAVELKVKSDYVARVEDISESTQEILVGLTNRKSSIELNKNTDALKFAIKVTDTKAIIVGKSIDVLEAAVDYFINNYLYRGGSKVGEWRIKTGETYVSEALPYNIGNIMSERTKYTVNSTLVGEFNGEIGGGCVYGDGYYVLRKDDTGAYRVVKYSMKDMSSEVVSAETYSGGELEYDLSQDRIMLSGKENTLVYLTPWGLEVSSEKALTTEIGSAAYIGDGVYAFLNSDGSVLKISDTRFLDPKTKVFEDKKLESISAEGKYIYLLDSDSGVIYVHDRWGNYINEIALDIGGKEARNVSLYNGKLYVGAYDSTKDTSELYEIGIEIK